MSDVKPRQIILRCSHELYFRTPMPKVGEIVYCPHCERTQQVVWSAIHPKNYSAICDECEWVFNNSKLTTIVKNSRAHSNSTKHNVGIFEPEGY